jgi:serine/threonine-protein kinase
MAMEYVEGHTLDKELKRRGRFTPAAAVEVLTPVADVLDAAHARGVVHRDLKPENIMLGRDERGELLVKVLDLGIAKLVGGDAYAANATALTTAGQILGTPYYMSPEQWGELPRDGHAEVDGRTDVYSLGVIAFELVAGRKPLAGQTLAELRQKHVAEPPPALEEAAPGVSREFGRAVARATAKDRGDRPPTAGAFVDELRAALGLSLRSRARGPAHETDSAHGVDARRTHTGGEAATAPLPPGALEQSRADTLLTSEFERHATDGAHAPASVQTRPVAPRGGGRQTVASGPSETAGDAPGPRADAGAHVAALPAESPRAGRRLAPLVAGGVLALLLVAAVGGWLAWRLAQGSNEERARPTPNAPANASAAVPTPPAVEPKAEVLNYWLEVFDRPEDKEGRRVAETSAALATGQRFRFHFYTQRRGYLYIIGPGTEANALMLILTAQGAGKWSKSNLVVGQADFAFPPGDVKLRLVGSAGTEDYTVIFSPTPLDEPSFLTGPFQHELTPAEVKQFEELRARHGADSSALEARAEGGEPRVGVSAPARATRDGAPVIFDIRISHR